MAKYHPREVAVELSADLTLNLLELRPVSRHRYWARVWPSSVALGQWLMRRGRAERGVGAKELGCGLGLVSATLSHLGFDTEGTDISRDALCLSARNGDRNRIAEYALTELDWAAPQGATSSLIVGSDIVYDPLAPGRLFDLIELHAMLEPGGKFVVSGPKLRSDLLGDLRVMFRDRGYSESTEAQSVDWEGEEHAIEIIELVRPR
ncbi:MAG: hypothetical protein HY791_20830 [Deltaproteobacteria bacterium]|nr:hypothetical protein [Deltaproteobacteria bacterium]